MGDRQYRIAVYNSSKDKHPAPQTLLLEDLYTLLSHDETDCVLADGTPGCRGKKCPQKDGLAWSPGFIPEGKTRLAANVEALDLAVFDIDHVTEAQAQVMRGVLFEHGLEFYLHTTHNHLPPDDQSFRLVLPFSRSVTPLEWKQLWFAIVRKFHLPADAATKDPARLSFFPRAMRGRAYENQRHEGVLLDPDALLSENARHSREVLSAPRTVTTAEPGSFNLDDLRARFHGYAPDDDFDGDKKEIVRRILAEESLCEKGERGSVTLRAGTITGWRMPLGTPFEVAFEILRPAFSKIETFEDDNPDENSLDAWMNQARRGYEKGQEDQEDRAIERADATGRLVALAKRKRLAAVAAATPLPSRLGPPPPPRLGPPPPAGPPTLSLVPPLPSPSVPSHFPIPVLDDDDANGEWRDQLITLTDKQGLVHPKNTFANLIVVLENHQAWKGTLKYNALRNEPEAHGGPIEVEKRDPKRLITAVRSWLAHNENLEMPRYEVVDAVEFVSLEHQYDPIRAYLTNIKHDGTPRIANWLINYCGAKLVDDSGLDVTDYVRMVGQKWLMAGAARGLYPGCKADNVLIFEGKQYTGKSMMLDILGGEWFLDTKISIGDTSALELTTQNWIIELAELASMKKSETETQKSFFSSRRDGLRLAYARRAEKFPRRCIFAGTTNETQYLLDLTGNRRFWCVWCETLDVTALRRDRDQLWAEAVALVRAGETCPNCFSLEDRCPEHRWWLDKDQTELAESVSSTRLKVEFVDEIRAWWYGRKDRPPHLTVRMILVDILGLTIDRKEQHQVAIGRAMKILGFTKENIRVAGGRERVYVPSHAAKYAPPPPVKTREELFSKIAAANVPAPKEKQ